MTRLVPLPYRKVRRALLSLGFVEAGRKGSHVHFRHADGRRTQVPRHAREDIGRGLLREIIRQAGVSVEEFLKHT